MSLALMDQLEIEVEDTVNDESSRTVVLTADGLDNFSVGMNLKQLSKDIQ